MTATAERRPGPAGLARWRSPAGLGAAIAGLAAVLAVPTPHRTGVTDSHPAALTASRPPSLTSRWPSAKPFPIPATLPGGLSYSPMAILDSSTSAGVASSPDQVHASLVIARASGPPRILHTDLAGEASTDAVTASATQLFWMRSELDAAGQQHTGLWEAGRATGTSRKLAADIGTPVLGGSAYDMQVRAGRLYWLDGGQDGTAVTRLRSIPVTGGPITTRVITGSWQLAAWPWLVSAPRANQAARLLNLASGEQAVVRPAPGKIVSCSPSWCRLFPDNAAQAQDTMLMRRDGSELRRAGTRGATPVTDEVALLDRFEPMLAASTSNAASTATALTLYDVRANSSVVIDPAATDARASGGFLWWSTGDNETRQWHGLDLRSLT